MPSDLPRELILIIQIWLLLNWLQIWQENQAHEQKKANQKPKRKRRARKKPEDFEGLTEIPLCEECEAAEDKQVERPQPPPMIEPTKGAPRTVDTSDQFCPNKKCRYYGWLKRGNISSNGHPSGGRTRQMKCTVCNKYFARTIGTVFYRSRVSSEAKLRALAALAEGAGIRAAGRQLGVEADTVWAWMVESAEHLGGVSGYLLHNLEIEQVQLDELYGVPRAVKVGKMEPEEGKKRLKKQTCWVWGAIDPVSKLMMGLVVGDRRLPMAQKLVHQVREKLSKDCVPLFLTDGLAEYGRAILTHFGHWQERQSERGRRLKPRWMPLAVLDYAQVVKKRLRRRVVRVDRRMIYGSLERTKAILARHGWQINTAFIERFNLTFRHHVPALGRRVNTLAKTEEGLRRQCLLAQAYYNFTLPHRSLRLAVTGSSTRKWQPRTPAMAAGATDRILSLEELLRFRVPPWPQEAVA